MKKFITKLTGFVMTFTGVVFASIYIHSKITIGSAIIGMLGILILSPAFDAWEKYFSNLFGFTDKNVDAK